MIEGSGLQTKYGRTMAIIEGENCFIINGGTNYASPSAFHKDVKDIESMFKHIAKVLGLGVSVSVTKALQEDSKDIDSKVIDILERFPKEGDYGEDIA